jgi:hypothetical protein
MRLAAARRPEKKLRLHGKRLANPPVTAKLPLKWNFNGGCRSNVPDSMGAVSVTSLPLAFGNRIRVSPA